MYLKWSELPDDVVEELLDPRFLNRTHHKKATYAKGCRGPLCRKEERDMKERARIHRALRDDVELEPRRQSRSSERDALLDECLRLHLHIRQMPYQVRENYFEQALGHSLGEEVAQVGDYVEDDDSVREWIELPDATEDHSDSVVRGVCP